uniref:Ig-like domain-containing protein n=2 Tax=Labrus bergylta TaxID=56723 RepID=A0A3Q3FNX3_9LABR
QKTFKLLNFSLSCIYHISNCIVDEEQVVKPVVSVYPAASRGRLEEKSSLLCLASAMFPPVVRISWRRQTESGCLEELPSADGQQLELRESGCTASVLQIYQTKFSYEYSCYVQHEGGTVEALIDTGNEGFGDFMQRRFIFIYNSAIAFNTTVNNTATL